jgi:hypothetical protein
LGGASSTVSGSALNRPGRDGLTTVSMELDDEIFSVLA